MDTDKRLAAIRGKTRQRGLFALITMGLYFSFVLNYTSDGAAVIKGLGFGGIPGSLVMFCALIIAFVCLELLFLFLNRDRGRTGV